MICGLTYKTNVSDLRNSLAFNIFKKLKNNNKKITGYDPLISNITAKKCGILNTVKNIKNFDIYIPITNHEIVRKFLSKINDKKKIVKIFD